MHLRRCSGENSTTWVPRVTTTSEYHVCMTHYQRTRTFISWRLRSGRLAGSLPHCSFCFRSIFFLVMLILFVRSGTKEVTQGTPPWVRMVQQSSKILLVPQWFTLNPDGTEPRPWQGWWVFVPLHEVPRTDSLFASYLEALQKRKCNTEKGQVKKRKRPEQRSNNVCCNDKF